MTDSIYDKICIGDKVCCTEPEFQGVNGIVVKKYFPTSCEEQTMIECADGRLFHAPTRCFVKMKG